MSVVCKVNAVDNMVSIGYRQVLNELNGFRLGICGLDVVDLHHRPYPWNRRMNVTIQGVQVLPRTQRWTFPDARCGGLVNRIAVRFRLQQQGGWSTPVEVAHRAIIWSWIIRRLSTLRIQWREAEVELPVIIGVPRVAGHSQDGPRPPAES